MDISVFSAPPYITEGGMVAKLAAHIKLTCPYYVDPITPHFYIVKFGFSGVYIIFFFFCSKTEIVGTEAVLTCTHILCFEHK